MLSSKPYSFTAFIRPLLLLPFVLSFFSCKSQKSFGEDQLVLLKTVPLPQVRGRMDHMDVNPEDQLVYLAALGNNSLEIIDIKKGKHVHSITGLDEPQGVCYIPTHKEIFVANGGNGLCSFYNAETYQLLASIKLSSDADDVRYDSTNHKIYVGYGSGGIAVIDADNHQQVANIPLPGHPEGFQLDRSLNRIFVNIPDEHCIAFIDLAQKKLIGQWKTEQRSNYPMAIDTLKHLLFIGFRDPALISVIDASTGKEKSHYSSVSDMDDLYFDENTKQILASGGGGSIHIFKDSSGHFLQTANIKTSSGARTSLLIPSLKYFVLAAKGAIVVYGVRG
jgi:WD40 repeat protein